MSYYLNNKGKLIEDDGSFFTLYSNLAIGHEEERIKLFLDKNTNKYVINNKALKDINEFFKDLRNYWKDYHKKIFRSKLKSKLNFSDLYKLNN